MPDVDRIILGLRLAVISDNEDEESTFLIDDEGLEGVVADVSEEDFITYSDEHLHQLSLAVANETVGQIFESLLDARTQIRAALEEVEIIEMFQNQEPDWEV